jgi:hypothetical protein
MEHNYNPPEAGIPGACEGFRSQGLRMRRCLLAGTVPESTRIVEYRRDRLKPNPVAAQGQTVSNRNRPDLRFVAASAWVIERIR